MRPVRRAPQVATTSIRDALNALHAYMEMRPKCRSLRQIRSVEAEIHERAEVFGLLVYAEMVKGLARPQPCPMCGAKSGPRSAR